MDSVNDTQAVEDVEDAAEGDSEREGVLRWRQSQFLALGVDPLEAELLADTTADLGLLRRLVSQGCPPALAVRIVR